MDDKIKRYAAALVLNSSDEAAALGMAQELIKKNIFPDHQEDLNGVKYHLALHESDFGAYRKSRWYMEGQSLWVDGPGGYDGSNFAVCRLGNCKQNEVLKHVSFSKSGKPFASFQDLLEFCSRNARLIGAFRWLVVKECPSSTHNRLLTKRLYASLEGALKKLKQQEIEELERKRLKAIKERERKIAKMEAELAKLKATV